MFPNLLSDLQRNHQTPFPLNSNRIAYLSRESRSRNSFVAPQTTANIMEILWKSRATKASIGRQGDVPRAVAQMPRISTNIITEEQLLSKKYSGEIAALRPSPRVRPYSLLLTDILIFRVSGTVACSLRSPPIARHSDCAARKLSRSRHNQTQLIYRHLILIDRLCVVSTRPTTYHEPWPPLPKLLPTVTVSSSIYSSSFLCST